MRHRGRRLRRHARVRRLPRRPDVRRRPARGLRPRSRLLHRPHLQRHRRTAVRHHRRRLRRHAHLRRLPGRPDLRRGAARRLRPQPRSCTPITCVIGGQYCGAPSATAAAAALDCSAACPAARPAAAAAPRAFAAAVAGGGGPCVNLSATGWSAPGTAQDHAHRHRLRPGRQGAALQRHRLREQRAGRAVHRRRDLRALHRHAVRQADRDRAHRHRRALRARERPGRTEHPAGHPGRQVAPAGHDPQRRPRVPTPPSVPCSPDCRATRPRATSRSSPSPPAARTRSSACCARSGSPTASSPAPPATAACTSTAGIGRHQLVRGGRHPHHRQQLVEHGRSNRTRPIRRGSPRLRGRGSQRLQQAGHRRRVWPVPDRLHHRRRPGLHLALAPHVAGDRARGLSVAVDGGLEPRPRTWRPPSPPRSIRASPRGPPWPSGWSTWAAPPCWATSRSRPRSTRSTPTTRP